MTSNFYLSFGFRAGESPDLRNSFNEALMSMKTDGTISILQTKYISDAGLDAPEPVKFEHYDNVNKTIKVAVTGDMPPIDFVAPDGVPAGFNTAVLAEIGKRLKINIELDVLMQFSGSWLSKARQFMQMSRKVSRFLSLITAGMKFYRSSRNKLLTRIYNFAALE